MMQSADTRKTKKEDLKRVIHHLHEGKAVEEVKEEFAALLEDVGATEIAELEQQLIDEGLRATEIQRLCDVHVAAFRDSLDSMEDPESLPGHPVYTMMAENAAAGRVLDALEAAVEQLKRRPKDRGLLKEARAQLRELQGLERHYLRKENVLFPFLEKHGFEGPSSVMWGIHDEIREAWTELEGALSCGPAADGDAFGAQLTRVLEAMASEIREMFYKEEKILFPTALEKLSGEEWWDIRTQSVDIGYAFVKPGDQWPPEETALETVRDVGERTEPADSGTKDLLHLDTGSLTPEMVNLLFNHLPIEISFVDDADEVRFFTQTGERIFPRSPAVIGRKVQRCHPPDSVDRVEEILRDFRDGTRDIAEFWIQMGGTEDGARLIHIQYFAVRDDAGLYRGTLEVVQDVTHIRSLKGEKRLLD